MKAFKWVSGVFLSSLLLLSCNTLVNYSDWYHVVATWDGYMLSIFVNGKLENSQVCNASPGNYSSDLFIGSFDGETSESSFHGVVDDLYIHRRVLTSREIRRLFDPED